MSEERRNTENGRIEPAGTRFSGHEPRGVPRETWIDWLDPRSSTPVGRAGALERLRSAGALPYPDRDGDLIVEVETRRDPHGGRTIRRLTKIVEHDCPECGHDRADRTEWAIYTCEHGHAVACRACGREHSRHSTL